MLNDGIHEAIISEKMWNQAYRKCQKTGVLQVKTHSTLHEHNLSGIIKCPVCRRGMQGNSTTVATDLELVPSPNLPKNEDSRQPQCPEDKERAIVEALKHFKMIQQK